MGMICYAGYVSPLAVTIRGWQVHITVIAFSGTWVGFYFYGAVVLWVWACFNGATSM
jgi:uncharacterized membrane protein